MCHVLIIEDEALVALHIETMLHDQGATSFSFAATEQEAISAALADRPGLITSDVQLLTGRGPAAVERILAEIGPVPVIFITGTPEACATCDPPAIVLTKPLTNQALAGAYRTLVGEGESAAVPATAPDRAQPAALA